MTFADLEVRANAAVMSRLTNARASIVGGGSDFPVVLSNEFVQVDDVGGQKPVITAADADVASVTANTTQLLIGATTYRVRDVQPDGTGLTLLVLEAA